MGLETVAAVGATGLQGVGTILQARNAARQIEAAENANTYLYDPTNPRLRSLGNYGIDSLASAFGAFRSGEENPFARYYSTPDVTNAIARASGVAQGTAGLDQGSLRSLLQLPELQFSQSQIPAEIALQQFQPQLNQGFSQELANPFAATQGVVNPGQNVVNAAQPLFADQLRRSNAQLASLAPGRFSSAFVQQGIDLNSQALNDFNLFAAQQLMAGEELRAQQQQAAQQFMLGARGLAQDYSLAGNQLGLDALGLFQNAALTQRGQSIGALDALRQAQLGARGLHQEGILGANEALQAQQRLAFEQQAAIAAMEMQRASAQANAFQQLLSQGLQYAIPSDLNAIVGGSGQITQVGTGNTPGNGGGEIPPPLGNPKDGNPPATPPVERVPLPPTIAPPTPVPPTPVPPKPVPPSVPPLGPAVPPPPFGDTQPRPNNPSINLLALLNGRAFY